LAKANGLRVIGTAGTELGMSDIKDQGADFVFNHREANYLDKIKEQFPNGVDIVIEMLANVNLNNDLQILKLKKGRVVVVGNRGNIEVFFTPFLEQILMDSIVFFYVLYR
jgi:NADPH2:quinone reductase